MQRLLIANRGEIAIRIARSAREMGLHAIATYSEDDAGSLHVRRADSAVRLEGKGPRAYLDMAALLAAARTAGADLVHPGYGFVSETADFAEQVEAQGLVWVGPTPETLRAFGDKTRALELAQSCNVPTLAGGDGPVSVKSATAFFNSLADGQAMMLKAVSGGGGRGVRIIRAADEIEEAHARAASEARASFGNDALYAEAYIPRARHIEVQIIGDGSGAVSHLWDRDCTLQRRHQKIIEIAPSPFLDADTRKYIINSAAKLAKATAYRGVGTMEFLVDIETGEHWFIEGNARLQVEHTVTEAITGVDLVRAQIEIAAGKSLRALGLTQAKIPEPDGYAVQARINLETMRPDGSILPAGGTLSAFSMPTGPGIRVDTYGYAGYRTNPAFDSLIAKVIAHVPGGSLDHALQRLSNALGETEIDGAPSNLGVLTALLADKRVKGGDVHTRFIDEHLEAFLAAPTSDPLAVLSHRSGGHAPDAAPAKAQGPVENGLVALNTTLQGTLVKLLVSPGDPVWQGRTVAIVEAMKMEHEVRSELSGIVQSLEAVPGDTLYDGHRLLLLEPEDVAPDEEAGSEATDLDHIRPDLAEALARQAAGHDESRPEAVTRRHARGNRTARENIADLCDEGTFVEYGSVVLAAQRKRRSMDDLIANTTGDGMVCGLGHVNGHLFPEERSRVMAMTYDYMVLAGTQGALNHYKKDRMFEIAEHQRLPTVLYAEGGGGRPGDTDVTGVAGLDCLAFTYFARLSGLVPTIGIVNGRCFAGNAVLLGCCDVIIATENANIGIGGPAMIEGGGLGVFAPEDVGPMRDQVPNGVVDIAVKDEAEATAKAKQYLSYFQGTVDDWTAPDARELRFAVPEERKRWYDMRKVIDGIADVGSVLELRPEHAIGILTALIRVEGRPVGVVANNPTHLSGAIDAPGADKGARFLQLCDAFDIPVLSLVDCPGIMVGPEIEKTALVRHASRMMVVGANITTPLMTVIIRKGYGLGAQAMAGGSFRAPLFTVTWPTGEFGGMGLEGAVKLGFRKELEAIKDPAERQKTYEEMVARSYERGKAVNMASHFELDDVIDPADTRRWIMAGLKSLPPAPVRTGKKRPNIDTW